jgi:pimeloyl-ACP methyl ester carboxylesterase
MSRNHISLVTALCSVSFSLTAACTGGAGDDAGVTDDEPRGRVVETTLLDSFTLDELLTMFDDESPLIAAAISPEFAVDVYRVLYTTIDTTGAETEASGTICLPSDATHALPLLSYQHGTIHQPSEAPSLVDDGERLIVVASAGAGYLAIAPDYLGMGLGTGFHPYVHAASEASATIDLLRAARRFSTSKGFTLSGDVFLMGYSQGGHATMATAMTIENDDALRDEFALKAVAPMAGPYDVSGVQAEVITRDAPYPDPSYLPYVLLAYDFVYDIWSEPSEVLVEPYASTVHDMFDGTLGAGDINALLPEVPNEILVPAVLDAFETDPDHFLREILRDNDLTEWTPTVPLRMIHCEGDAHVAFANAEVALERFTARGSTTVELKSMGADLDHNGCVLPALLDAKEWFDGFVRGAE